MLGVATFWNVSSSDARLSARMRMSSLVQPLQWLSSVTVMTSLISFVDTTGTGGEVKRTFENISLSASIGHGNSCTALRILYVYPEASAHSEQIMTSWARFPGVRLAPALSIDAVVDGASFKLFSMPPLFKSQSIHFPTVLVATGVVKSNCAHVYISISMLAC